MNETMKKKLAQTLTLIAFVFVLPLLPVPIELISPQVLLAMALAFILNMTSPTMNLHEAFMKTKTDALSFLAIVVVGILGFFVPVIDYAYFQRHQPFGTMSMIGALIAYAGLGFRIWSIRILGKFFTARVEIQSDHQIVQNGPYRFIRHPSYLGAWVMYIGTSLMLGSTLGLIFSLLGFSIVYHYRTIVEEKSLAAELGQAYEDYQKQSWKMIPYVY